jgi:hypothetical protein
MTDVTSWLLDSDPSLQWQVLRDIVGATASVVTTARARVATEGLGAELLDMQDATGTWGGAAWNHGWNSTMHVLTMLKDFGAAPADPRVQAALGLVDDHVTWRGCGPDECATHRFFEGETEPCINGQVACAGAYFGHHVTPLIRRLVSEQLPDGGWNCDAERGSVRSSFNTTICVLEALLEHERVTGDTEVREARLRGEAYLLERRLMRRRSTGETILRDRKGSGVWSQFAFPVWWHYDVLRALDYLRSAEVTPEERMATAIDLVRSKRDASGRWALDVRYPGQMPVDLGEDVGAPSRWVTFRALRVLRWYDQGTSVSFTQTL